MADRCARSRSRPTARRRSPAASTPRRSAGRCSATRPSRCCASTRARSTRSSILKDGRIATSGEDARIAIWTPGAAHARRWCSKATRRRWWRSRSRRTARCSPPHRGITPRGCGRSTAARRACSKAMRRTSTASRSRRTAARLGHRRLRRDAAHLAARRRRLAGRHHAADAAQCGGGRARRRDRHRRRRRQGLSAVCRGRIESARSKPRRRRSSRSRSRPTASSSPRPASAARSRSSTAPRARSQRTLVGPGLPVWSVAFFPDSRTLLTGGTDRMIRRWDAVTGEPIGTVVMGAPEDPLAAFAGDPGAEVFRACVACHTLKADDGVRAGPTLAGIFGRRIATPAGLQFLRGAEEARHRVDAGDGVEAVRGRPDGLHARHQDAGAEHRLARGPRRAGAVSGEGDEVGATLVVALFGASLRAPTRGAPTYVPSTSSHRYVARTSSNTASATSLGVSCGRLCPATGITRC